jgi:hypothetical protein
MVSASSTVTQQLIAITQGPTQNCVGRNAQLLGDGFLGATLAEEP